MTIAPEKIAELRALLEKAMPRPWEVKAAQGSPDYYIKSPVCASERPLGSKKSDLECIAALRNAAPELLDEIERLRSSEQQLMRDLTDSDADHDYNRVCSERDRYRDMAVKLAKDLRARCVDSPDIAALLKEIENG